MATDSVNPFNQSDSEEESDQRPGGAENECGPSGQMPGPGFAPRSPQADSEPAVLPLFNSKTSPGVDGFPVLAVNAGGNAEARLSADAIAAQLLRDQYVLTALEFHTELLESGRELPRLRDYFSNPGNFERQSGTPPGGSREQGLGIGGQLSK